MHVATLSVLLVQPIHLVHFLYPVLYNKTPVVSCVILCTFTTGANDITTVQHGLVGFITHSI